MILNYRKNVIFASPEDKVPAKKNRLPSIGIFNFTYFK